MYYVTADIHGEYEKYAALLEKIGLTQDDTLYVLGDVIDRGREGIRILRDMMQRENVYLLRGNHELMATHILRRLNVEITEENAQTQVDAALIDAIWNWRENGGDSTLNAFCALSAQEREDVLDYMEDTPLYAVEEAGGKTFVLVHAGLGAPCPGKKLRACTQEELCWQRPDFEKQYFPDDSVYVVCGHTPTQSVTGKTQIYQSHNNILIDCGAAFGGRLACLCLDTMAEFYV